MKANFENVKEYTTFTHGLRTRLKSIMENMPKPCLERAQFACKIVKPVEQTLRRLSNEYQMELMKYIKPCSVKLDVLQGTQNFKVKCLIHNRYECKCIIRNKRNVKCRFCSGCIVQNKLIKAKKKHYRCKTTKINTSQPKQRKQIKSLNCVNREFLKESGSADTNVCIDDTSSSVQEISNDSSSKTLNSYNFSSDKILRPEECCPDNQCDKLNGYVFVDVGSDLVGSDYLFEEDGDICKVNSETFSDHKDIDYHLVKSVKIERNVKGTSKENEINIPNLDATVFNISDICANSDRPGSPTSANMENVYENMDSYDKKPNICINYTRTSDIVSASGGFEEVNVKEEHIEDVLVHQCIQNIIPKIKEEMVNNEEVSIVNESIIDIKLHTVNKIEELPDIVANNTQVLDEHNKTGILVLSKSVDSDFEEYYTERSDEFPDNCNVEIETKNDVIVHNSLKATEAVKSTTEYHSKLQNEVQTLSRTCSELQIKLKTISRDYRATETREACVNKQGEVGENLEVISSNDEMSQRARNRKTELTLRRCYVCEVCSKGFMQMSSLNLHKRIHTGDRLFVCSVCQKAFTRLDYLKIHKRIHTGDRPFGCTICGKAFVDVSNLRVHKRIHTGDRPFGCIICGKAFTHLASLKSHKLVHAGDRPFSCTICGKAFTQLAHLNRHKHIHSGDRPFGCTICGKAFTRLSDLQRHKRIHTGEKPYSCNLCDARFTNVTNLRKHKQRHTDERPFGCSI